MYRNMKGLKARWLALPATPFESRCKLSIVRRSTCAHRFRVWTYHFKNVRTESCYSRHLPQAWLLLNNVFTTATSLTSQIAKLGPVRCSFSGNAMNTHEAAKRQLLNMSQISPTRMWPWLKCHSSGPLFSVTERD